MTGKAPTSDAVVGGAGIPASPLGSILCAVNGSRADADATRQAAILADGTAALRLVAVAWEGRAATSAQVTLTRVHARRALDAAVELARDAGARPSVVTLDAPDAAAAIVPAADGHDLLVLGSSGHGRLRGIVLGRCTSAALHRAQSDVLIARPVPEDRAFPGTILFAHDGTAASARAERLVAWLAARHGVPVIVAVPHRPSAAARRAISQFAADLILADRPEPVIVEVTRPAHESIPPLAAAHGASLLALGSRRLTGARALGSVSERVAHAASCSVLVARAAGRP